MLRLLSSSLGIALSLLIFQSGFLLRRQELQLKSQCTDAKLRNSVCWMKQQYSRVILLLVDALRADFLAPIYSPNSGDIQATHFHTGHMKIVEKLVSEKKAAVGRVLADAPTTTLQRLKALTTGNLPTFIDASDNFSPDAVVLEDNFLWQIRQRAKNITLLGDDTWLSLYPSSFAVQHVYPSFDINDLTTNDDNIRPLLKQELENSTANSELVIAHFLGVDHCGHKHGPNHPKMADILQKMDAIIGETVAAMRETDLLVVVGDHGMTSTGDHGGDSDDEITAGLFIYSPSTPFVLPSRPFQQIDLVPTLSLLLGVPIPFSNLGSVIGPMLPRELRGVATALNYEQIKRFAETYASIYSFSELHAYLPQYDVIEREEQLKWMSRIQSALRAAWTRFDVSAMRLGLLALLEAMLFLKTAYQVGFAVCAFRSGLILLQLAILFGGTQNSLAVPMLQIIASLSCCHSLLSLLPSLISSSSFRLSFFNLLSPANIAVLFNIIHAASLLSNSFIVYEGQVLRFLLQSLWLIVWMKERFLNSSITSKQTSSNHRLAITSFPALLLGLAALRMETTFHRCREEEIGCEMHSPLVQFSALEGPAQLFRLMLGIVSLMMLNIYIRRRLISMDASLSDSRSVSHALLTPAQLGIFMHNVIKAVPIPPNLERQVSLVAIGVAQSVYALSIAAFLLAVFSRSQHSSARLFLSVMSLSHAFLLLLGDGLLPAGVLFLLITVEVCRECRDAAFLAPVLSLLVSFGFYLTGHSPTLTAIPWPAAFVGLPGNFPIRALPALLILTHICFSSLVICASSTLCHPTPLPGLFHSLLFLSALTPLGASLAALIHRRHLMVWKIFAPKFIFEGVNILYFIVILNITAFIITRRKQTIITK